MLLAGDVDMGHARALLAVDAAVQIQLANVIIARRLSVRETEKLVTQALKETTSGSTKRAKGVSASRDLTRLEEALSDQLGTRVSLKVRARERGQIVIDFQDWEHLNALLERQGLAGVIDA
jgi:ParB family chromosome partitioning protein